MVHKTDKDSYSKRVLLGWNLSLGTLDRRFLYVCSGDIGVIAGVVECQGNDVKKRRKKRSY